VLLSFFKTVYFKPKASGFLKKTFFFRQKKSKMILFGKNQLKWAKPWPDHSLLIWKTSATVKRKMWKK